jgi:hypothetical protein
LPRPVSLAKIFRFAATPNHPYKSRHPVPLEGRWPSSRTLGRVAVDAAALGAWWCSQGGPWFVSGHSVQTTGAEAYGKAVWFWHPWLVSSWRRLFESNRVRPAVNPAAMEAKGSSSPGRARYKPSNHCAGNAGLLWLYLYARVRISLHPAHETAGASRRPAFPAPSDFGGTRFTQTSGAMCREIAKVYPRHCERSAAIHTHFACGKKDCIAALAMTAPESGTTRNSPALANEWQLRQRQSALTLNTPLLNPRP